MKKIVSLAMSLSMLLSMGAAVISAQASKKKSDIEGVDFETYQFYYSRDENGDYTVPHHLHTYYVIDSEYGNTGGVYYQTEYQSEDDYKYVIVTLRDDTALDALTKALGEETSEAPQPPITESQFVYNYSSDIDYSALYTIEGVEKIELSRFCWRSRFLAFLDPENENLIAAHIETEDDVVLTADMFPGYTVDSISKEVGDSGEEYWVVKYEFEDFRTSMEFDCLAETIDGVTSSDFGFSLNEFGEEVIFPSRTVEPPAIQAPEPIYGDFDHNGVVNAIDASILLMYSAESGNGVFTGTFEEYVNENYPVQ